MSDVALLLTPIPSPRFLTALCALTKVRGRVLETSGGPVAVLDDASPESAERSARAVSGFLKGSEFLLAESRAGNVRVQSWKGGAVAEELPAGLVLADSPGVVTSLLTGVQTLDQVAETHDEKIHSTDIGRVKAYRELLRETKALKKGQGE
ncbi:hypothetical protein [Demequina soli]|uniref:hypothetical protein n=1 Tax=Demequina soli TaxID=1638987 RepID=UPI0007843E37|nr:hypothetical protein [Demequina soli]